MKTYKAVFIDDLTGEDQGLLEWHRPAFTRREFKMILDTISYLTLTLNYKKVRCYLYCGSKCVHEFIAVRYDTLMQPFVHVLCCTGLRVCNFRTLGRVVR